MSGDTLLLLALIGTPVVLGLLALVGGLGVGACFGMLRNSSFH